MMRWLRYTLYGVLGIIGLLLTLTVGSIGVGILAGYLNAPKATPRGVEVVKYTDSRPVPELAPARSAPAREPRGEGQP